MKTRKTKKNAFQANMEVMTNKRIESMIILDSQGYIRFLQDPSTGLYVIFNGRLNASHFSKAYQSAERFFKKQISISQ